MTTADPATAATPDSLALDAARRALEDMSRRARMLIDTANDAVVTIDSASVIIDWNRTAERMLLVERLQLLLGGQGGVVIIEGEAGLGKSRLVEELLQQAASINIESLVGAGDAIEQATPYFAWRFIFSALFGADLARAAVALAQQTPAAGRGTRIVLEFPKGRALLIDESYNANPTSMRAALALLGQSMVGPSGRRIAVMGDMLELGAAGEELHRDLVDPIRQHGILDAGSGLWPM